MTFKEKLVILRKSKGLTQDEFASAVGVSRQAVYKWESGQSYPEVPKLLEMKLLFTISIDELLDDNYNIPLPEKKKRKRKVKENVEREVKAPAIPKAEPVVKPEPVVAPKVEPVKVAPVRTIPEIKVAPAAPVAPKAEPIKVEPIKVEPTVKEEETLTFKKIDYVPNPGAVEKNPIVLEDEPENQEEEKKGGFFGRLFGRR